MTKEQQIRFEHELFHCSIYENSNEASIARRFFELGINITIDEILKIVESKSNKMYVHTVPGDDTNPLICFAEAIRDIKKLRENE